MKHAIPYIFLFFLPFVGVQVVPTSIAYAQKTPKVKKRIKKDKKRAKKQRHRAGRQKRPNKATGIGKFTGPVAVYPAAKVITSDYSGDIPTKGIEKRQKRIDKSNRKKGRYSGTVLAKDLNRIQRAARKTDKQRARYRGTIPYNYQDIQKRRAKLNKKLSEYRGFIVVKKAPRKVTTKTRQKDFYKKPYDARKLKKGLNRLPLIGVRKSDIPRWQREKVRKPTYDRKENEIWVQPREVPVAPKESKTEMKEEEDVNQDKE